MTTTRVQANDAGQAKKLVKAQYGDWVEVPSTKRMDQPLAARGGGGARSVGTQDVSADQLHRTVRTRP